MNSAPYIQFYPTVRCNINCHFCFNKGLRVIDDVRVADFQKIIIILKKAGVTCIDILGGEPTLHPGLVSLLDSIRKQQMICNLSSNGTNIAILQGLSARFEKEFLRVGISLNDSALSAALHEYIFRHRPALKSVLTNTATIPKSCEPYIGQAGIDYFILYMDVVDGRNLANSLPFDRFYGELGRLKKMHRGLDGVFCSGFIPDQAANYPLKSVRCPAGTAKLSILPDGSVYPCYLFFRYPEFALGNILRDDFQKIWQNPILDFFRSFTENHCPDTGCTLFSACHGGCPAMSYIFHHDLDAPDPRCKRVNITAEIIDAVP
ncbi:MAG: radical SAM protein [Candidatus Levybacteria bacterium]|nr:radical SAM protein [Candidatus Levybacteria bacterium]